MRKLILTGMLMLSLLGAVALAFQNSNKKPTPRPTPPRASPKPTASPVRAKPTPTPVRAAPTSPVNSVSFVDSVFNLQSLTFLVCAGVVGFFLALIVGHAALGDSPADAALRGLEAAILAVLGGLLARMFVALLLSTAKDLAGAQIAVGWGFFLFPGAVDTIARLAADHVVTTPEFLLILGMAVGAFTGMMNGLWQIHDWKGVGWIAFPLDVTWGLAGATTGALLHVINFAWAKHADETRYDAHRYKSGMRFKGTFALTQGPVMSNLTTAPAAAGAKKDTLYYHERTHVWQNRIFGPFFTLTYLGWMAFWLVPALIAAAITRDGEAIEAWCYYNNPWETWAYLVGAGPRASRHALIFGDVAILVLSIPYFIGIISLFIWLATKAW
jgi:hypothetical protein